ncbi:MAG: aminodeoxychorismate synthase component I [Deltaproteobacteria bacterium]|nr:aminodeoxychorismate synthase component I [Deltaproteobacteria bacterium]
MQQDKIKNMAGQIDGVHIEDIHLTEPFIDFSARFASMEGSVILLSGGKLDSARYHILAAKPWLSFLGRNRNMEITIKDQSLCFEGNPFDTLRMLLETFSLEDYQTRIKLPEPVSAGLFGYFSYDLKDHLEKLPKTSVDDLGLPHIRLFAPSIIVVHDKKKEVTRLCIPKRMLSGKSTVDEDLDFFKSIVNSNPPKKGTFSGDPGGFRSNFTKANYLEALVKIKEYIASGHVYQVNMSQRFEMDFKGDTFSLFETLYHANPAPFFAYINAGDHQIVSTSPERFVQRIGKYVETRPIKGTKPRGKTEAEDQRLKISLKQSKKDDAELSMIVDLLRNDIGKVCEGGSVRVSEHKRLEPYKNVYHLVSVVEGVLDKDSDSVDLITATFPGGSITGCPKIRSMEIIDELEPNRRHIYTGSIGYVGFHDTMDLSIVIRTVTIYNGKIIFSVGGGIVFDSDPSDEFDETLHKGRTLMEVFQGKGEKTVNKNFVWLNGTIKPMDQAAIPITDQGFQYGYGFFETIRVDKGKPKYLKEHIRRFYKTWNHLFSQEIPDLTWDKIINQVIIQNKLTKETAAVKILATKGDRISPPFNHTLLVTARPYTHRLEEKNEQGLHLLTYPNPRLSPLADYKTLNYLYYFLAGKWAKFQGADEALIMNPDNTVSETNTANILLIKDKTVIRPVSTHVLPGIMEGAVCELLIQWGYRIENNPLLPEELYSADQVFITNSLIGAVPILSIDKTMPAKPSDLCQKINTAVL